MYTDGIAYLEKASADPSVIAQSPEQAANLHNEAARLAVRWGSASDEATQKQIATEAATAAVAARAGFPGAPELPEALAAFSVMGNAPAENTVPIAPTAKEIFTSIFSATPVGAAAKAVLGPEGAVATGIKRAKEAIGAELGPIVVVGGLGLLAWALLGGGGEREEDEEDEEIEED